jgi:AcrR family transcriptional regulator
MKTEDPRVTRTRKLLLDAFAELLTEKGFHAVSVQDIAERATVNRATFYAHFDDKYALFEQVVREQFRQELAARGLAEAPVSEESFRRFIETVLAFVGQLPGRCRPSERDMELTVEACVEQEIAAFLGPWLRQIPGGEASTTLPPETAAAILSWAIFGAGIEWSRAGGGESLSDWAGQVQALLSNGLCTLGRVPGPSTLATMPR